jgi:hypothetical protein
MPTMPFAVMDSRQRRTTTQPTMPMGATPSVTHERCGAGVTRRLLVSGLCYKLGGKVVSKAATIKDLPLSEDTKQKLGRLLQAKGPVDDDDPEIGDVLSDIDEQLRDPAVSPAVKGLLRELRKDIVWLKRWSPLINRMNEVFFVLSEFGVQMASTIFVGILLMGVVGWTFSAVVVTAFFVFVVIWWVRYQIILVSLRKLQTYARHGAAIMGAPPPPPISREQLAEMRRTFLQRMGYFALSLLLVLFFTARILGTSAEILGIKLFDTFLNLLGDVLGNVVVDVILLAAGGALGIYAKSKESRQPEALA